MNCVNEWRITVHILGWTMPLGLKLDFQDIYDSFPILQKAHSAQNNYILKVLTF